MSRILAVHNSHNASICEINNNDIIYFQEAERLDRSKKSKNWEILFDKYRDQKFDKIIFLQAVEEKAIFKESSLIQIEQIFNSLNIECLEFVYEQGKHHFFHACCSFFNSGLKKSYVLVSDGSGSFDKNKNVEMISLYYFNKNKFKKIFQVYKSNTTEYVDKKNTYINTVSLGNLFEITKNVLGYKEEGSIMGLSCYYNLQKDTDSINKDGVFQYPFAFKKFNHFQISQEKLMFLNTLNNRKPGDKEKSAPLVCKSVQIALEKIMLQYIKNITKGKKRNVCVSGGVFQNTILNSKILDIVPNLYVDPFADDSGLSMGVALWHANKEKFKCNKIKNLFLGDSPDYSVVPLKHGLNVSVKDVAKLISEKNIVAIYQGRNETGKRALGNRSFLYDPRDFFAKERLNILKKREFFRPVAGTVLHEHADEWFDLKSKKETPFMSYVFKVKKEGIPGITHIDETCRIQTLKKEQNFYYYALINEFYKLTNIPMLANTSFNLAGEPLINTPKEALFSLMPNENLFEYLYFPELGKLFNNNSINNLHEN